MGEHVFPAWLGWLLVNPLRKLYMDPEEILGPYIKKGMTVLEPGCATGFFSLPAARMVGIEGKLICVDLQAGMIKGLKQRAKRAGLLERIRMRVCSKTSLQIDDLEGKVDFAFAIGVVHEVPDEHNFFKQICAALKTGGKMVFAEPKAPVSIEVFERSIKLAEQAGLQLLEKRSANNYWLAVICK